MREHNAITPEENRELARTITDELRTLDTLAGWGHSPGPGQPTEIVPYRDGFYLFETETRIPLGVWVHSTQFQKPGQIEAGYDPLPDRQTRAEVNRRTSAIARDRGGWPKSINVSRTQPARRIASSLLRRLIEPAREFHADCAERARRQIADLDIARKTFNELRERWGESIRLMPTKYGNEDRNASLEVWAGSRFDIHGMKIRGESTYIENLTVPTHLLAGLLALLDTGADEEEE